MGAPKRYKILGCQLKPSPESWAATYKNDFFGLGGYPHGWNRQGVREDDILCCCGMLALRHLGYKVPVEPADWLNRGFDVVVDYFCGEWWHGDEDATATMDKTPGNERLRWFNAFTGGMLLGLLSERWDDLAAVCAWLEPGLRPEPLRMEEDPAVCEHELALVYLSIAAFLRPGLMHGMRALEKELLMSKELRPRLLFQAWKAARAGDQASFAEGFVKSLAHFAATPGRKLAPLYWVATHCSVVGLAAMRVGLDLPQLPPNLEALVMTRASLGLDLQTASPPG